MKYYSELIIITMRTNAIVTGPRVRVEIVLDQLVPKLKISWSWSQGSFDPGA